MKKLISFISMAFLMSTALIASASAEYQDCGKWYDVPQSYMTILTEVCEYGLMQGKTEFDYGFGEDLSRSAAATISNRIVLGSDYYDNIQYSMHDLSDELESIYRDMPDPTPETDWMIKAIYFAYDNGVMRGDDGNLPTTFRHLETINIPELFKVLFESFNIAGVMEDKVEYTNLDYNADPWYGELLSVMDKEGVILNLDLDAQTFKLSGSIGTTYIGFETDMQREDAALFLHAMISNDMLDEEALAEHVN